MQCTVCNLYFRNRDELARHTQMAHKKSGEPKIKCYQCDIDFESEKEVKSHIRNNHKTYKPCKNFAANQCQYADDEYSFNHVILQQDQHICFKCGNKYSSKTEMMNHVKEKHGDIICHRFLKNQCPHNNRCLFSHNVQSAKTVIIDSGGSQAPVTPIPTAQDFRHPLTAMGPAVGREERAKTNFQQVQQMSLLNQQQILSVTTQVISQLMPAIMIQINATLASMNPNPIPQ